LEEILEVAPGDQPVDKTEPDASDNSAEKEITIDDKIQEDIDWSNYLEEYNSPSKINFESEHLLWQLLMTSPTDAEQKIGSLIIGNLNNDGYLEIPTEELVRVSGESSETVEHLLQQMQTFDPVGVCSRDLKECLLTQLKHLDLNSPIVIEIIENHLTHIENKNYKAISKALKISFDDTIAAVNIIKGLEPKPGRQFSEEETQYIYPDIFVYKYENDFVITLNDDGMPKLRINSFYRKSIADNDKFPNNTKDYIQDKMRSATWLIKSIHQRQKTIYRVMESILRFQRDFFEHGISYLKPMVLRDVAQDIDMHESTISRVTTNKYAHTPQGIFELKYFFNSPIKRIHGAAVASASVQDKIRQIILSEDPKKPYSDDKLSVMLKESNIDIARRTVAKYREMLGVLSSNKRKQV
ncbi:MAG: RNA polymerase factor sigma-54, partial [Deltaproteobacteria bacterium]|nr:RNA polymerase factor sigma-54 [Deltaproteobacteria bacterium]